MLDFPVRTGSREVNWRGAFGFGALFEKTHTEFSLAKRVIRRDRRLEIMKMIC